MDKLKLLEGLKKIKEAFQTTVKFTDAKLNDGVTIVRYDGDMLAIGVPVLAVTDQGAIAIPDGEYTLEDGTVFTITNGVVAEVSTTAEENADDAGTEPTPAQAQPSAKPAAAMTEAKAKSIIESVIKESRFVTEDFLTEKIADLIKEKETFASQKLEAEKNISDLKTESESQKGIIKQMFALLETIAGEPSAKPAEAKGKPFNVSEFRKSFKADLQKIENEI